MIKKCAAIHCFCRTHHDTQPLRTQKNHTTSWDHQTNHATSWDKKITQPLGTKKNHATSRDKKIKPPLRTKKSCNLSGKKIMQPLGTKNIILQYLGTKKSWRTKGNVESWLPGSQLSTTLTFGTMPHIFGTTLHIFGTMPHIFGTMPHLLAPCRTSSAPCRTLLAPYGTFLPPCRTFWHRAAHFDTLRIFLTPCCTF